MAELKSKHSQVVPYSAITLNMYRGVITVWRSERSLQRRVCVTAFNEPLGNSLVVTFCSAPKQPVSQRASIQTIYGSAEHALHYVQ